VVAVRQKIEDAREGKDPEEGEEPDLPLTRAAKRVLELAMTEARELKHTYVGTEHLLLGLLREEQGMFAAKTLRSAGITLAATRAAIVDFLAEEVRAGTAGSSARHVVTSYTFSDRLRKVLRRAREEAARLHHDHIRTEHILLGLTREGEGNAAAVLTELNVDLEGIQRRIEEIAVKGKAKPVAGPYLLDTWRARTVLRRAMREMDELHHSIVGTEHLLLGLLSHCLLYTSPSPRDLSTARMPSSA